jgi:hypothetical protein
MQTATMPPIVAAKQAALLRSLRFWRDREYRRLEGYRRRLRIGRNWEDAERGRAIERIAGELAALEGGD